MNITAIVPNYNHSKYLRERINSVINQTQKPDVIIILDDCSDDSSHDIINEFVISDIKLVKYFNTENSGSTFIQWNKGVSIENNEFIWIAESDDMADPNLLASLIETIQSDSEIVLAYCQSNSINEEGVVTSSWINYTSDLDEDGLFSNNFSMDGKEFIQRFLIHKNTIPNASGVLFRKSVYDKVDGAPVHLKTNGDWLTWLKMLCLGKIAYLAEPLNYFRYHEQSVIARCHKINDAGNYIEQYDRKMRNEFSLFLRQKRIFLPKLIHRHNNYYISLDEGNEGLFHLQHQHFWYGWKKVLAASFSPTLQSGFIKKALRVK